MGKFYISFIGIDDNNFNPEIDITDFGLDYPYEIFDKGNGLLYSLFQNELGKLCDIETLPSSPNPYDKYSSVLDKMFFKIDRGMVDNVMDKLTNNDFPSYFPLSLKQSAIDHLNHLINNWGNIDYWYIEAEY